MAKGRDDMDDRKLEILASKYELSMDLLREYTGYSGKTESLLLSVGTHRSARKE